MFNQLQGLEPSDYKPTALGAQPTLSDLLTAVMNIMIGIGFSLAIISIAYSGIIFVLSQGDPKQTKKGYDAFLWGVIAGAVSLGIIVIKQAILITTTGITTGEIVNDAPGF